MLRNKRLIILAAHSKDNIVPDYLVHYAKELAEVGDIIYVADNNLPRSEVAKIERVTGCVIAEEHGEYDFGSYKRGFMYALDKSLLQAYNWVVLCNDSVYGPFYPLVPIFETMEAKDPDVWGFTKNTISEIKHLQSYFVAMSKDVFTHAAVIAFLKDITRVADKREIVQKYEKGLSRLLSDLGFSLLSFNGQDRNFRYDPQGKYYLEMIKSGFPFLKRNLLGTNPNKVCNLHRYQEIRYICPEYPFSILQKNLARVVDKDILTKNLNVGRVEYLLAYLGRMKYSCMIKMKECLVSLWELRKSSSGIVL